MTLPHVERAIIPERKLTEYLLSPTHRTGRDKAAFFTRFGFSRAQWETLANALRRHAVEQEVNATELTAFGMNYVVEGVFYAPDGRAPNVLVVWFIETGAEIPTLATVYPLKGGKE